MAHLLLVAAGGRAGRYPVWATATDRAGNTTLLGLPWVRVGEDTKPPDVRAALDGHRLEWRASDSKSPWFDVRLERRVGGGKIKTRVLGRFERLGAARLGDSADPHGHGDARRRGLLREPGADPALRGLLAKLRPLGGVAQWLERRTHNP